MWCYTFLIIAIVSCYAEEYSISTVDVSTSEGEGRIIGGSPTTIEKYPFTVQLLLLSQFICGGSLITKGHVLTAAHCFAYEINPIYYSVRMGSSLLNTGGSLHLVSAIIIHEGYNAAPNDNDVAVLVLSSPATLSASVATASIPVQGYNVPDNATVVAVGWGKTNTSSIATVSETLNEVVIRTVNRFTCFSRYLQLQNETQELLPTVTDNMICAGILDVGGKDACQGDSGGPLIYSNVVVGITSWGYGCALPKYPGVYARVSSYANWINNTVTKYGGGSARSQLGSVTLITSLLILLRTYTSV